MDMNDSRTPIGRVKGLGAAGTGTHHWIMQRLNSIALLILGPWFVLSLAMIVRDQAATITEAGTEAGTEAAATGAATYYKSAIDWIQQPLASIFLALLIIATAYHIKDGVQVVIEDYIHNASAKVLAIIALNFGMYTFAIAGIFLVFRISFA